MNKSPFFRYGSVILLTFCLFRFFWWLFPDLCAIWDLQVADQITRLARTHQERRPASPDIVHIDLDNASVASLPYDVNDPRLFTELVRILKEAGVRSILIDMVFPYCRNEPDCNGFANAVDSAANVYLPVILSQQENEPPVSFSGDQIAAAEKAAWHLPAGETFDLLRGEVTLSNLKNLDRAAAGLGHINSPPDIDGVYRRLPLLIQTAAGPVPSIALQTICGHLGISPNRIRIPDDRKIVLTDALFPDGRSLDITIPVDRRGRNRINFNGAWNDSFSHYSFATIIETGATPAGILDLTDELEGTLAIVSDVSIGSRDYGPVPLSSYFPLSGLHSHFINSMMENDFIRESRFSHRLAMDALLIVLLTLSAFYLRGVRFALAGGAVFTALILTSISLYMEQRLLVPLVRPSLSFLFAGPGIMLMQFFEVQKKEQYIRGRFSHYFAPPLMDKILREPELLNTVEKKELTVLFSDIVGFTSWSSTRDAQEIHRVLNRYFEEMAAIVFAHQGTIDKYMGDGLMVFFGDPVPCENHSQMAVQAAVAMQKKTRELRAMWEKAGGMPIAIRIGIHTGEVVVGNMGSESRMEYTVIGSNVNLAQRLESNCEPGGILLSEQVYRNLDGAVAAQEAGTIRAKGFPEPVPVYTVAIGGDEE